MPLGFTYTVFSFAKTLLKTSLFQTLQRRFLSPNHRLKKVFIVGMTLKKKAALAYGIRLSESGITNPSRYRTNTVPSAGALLKQEDTGEKQISFDM